ncbi:TPA: type I-F CRISPR-associated endoribonuclease Cas6/Csy4 [Vibrio parahaemolyticus]|nr:type I-F CRISPR-associated endoribonuclease Cas6/Csy4 [Vibrio parahaemolyticus]
MTWYYKSVSFLPQHRNNEVLVGKCLKKLHGFCKKYKSTDIGVSFPDWAEDTIGNRITFVSQDPMKLDFLLQQHYFQEMKTLGYFSITECMEVPKDCAYASFRRNQEVDESTAKGQARKARRRKARAFERGEDISIREELEKTTFIFEHYHSIRIFSKSKGREFPLNIQRELEIPDVENSKFTSYGLSNKKDCQQSVPLI